MMPKCIIIIFFGKGYYYGIWLWQTNGGGTLHTYENVHIHHNITSWFQKGGIGIEGFHNTLIENNVIQSDGGLENTYPAAGIVFLGGDPTNNISGFLIKTPFIDFNPLTPSRRRTKTDKWRF